MLVSPKLLMKSPLYLLVALTSAAALFAEDEKHTVPAMAGDAPVVTGAQYPAEKLDELLGPIALYPDALVALILPASTAPSDIVLAARYLQDGGDKEQLDEQPWEDSVRALAHYPDVIEWMDNNLAWTKQLGEAFVAQPADVMNSVQRLRAKARATGALVDTPQQKVVVEDENIVIAPADPEVIYVPYYDPTVVYVERTRYVSDPFLTFGIGYSAGYWLGYGLDWRYHRVWWIDPIHRHRHWNDRHAHHHWYHHHSRPSHIHRPNFGQSPHYHAWKPRPGYVRPPRYDGDYRPRREVARPAPFPRESRSMVNVPRAESGSLRPSQHNPRTSRPVSNRPAPVTSVVPSQSPEVNVPATQRRSTPGTRPDRSERINRPSPSGEPTTQRQRPERREGQNRVQSTQPAVQPSAERAPRPATERTVAPSPRATANEGQAQRNFQRPERAAPPPSRPTPEARERRSAAESRPTTEQQQK
jgi:hypothetical protein